MFRLFLLMIGFWFPLGVFASPSLMNTQTLQIHTQFKSYIGKPTWLLIVRDVETGEIFPYVFDIHKEHNFWVAFTYGHHYQITASKLTFGPFAVINNFCHLENGILSGISMYMQLTGVLTPDPKTLKCHVFRYHDLNFTIANPKFH